MDDENEDFSRNPNQMEIGHEPMTDAQRVELELLSRQTGEPTPDDGMTRAEASEKIETLRQQVDEESDTGVKQDDTDTILGDDE
ncbi:MAG TPA: DUF3072 domain-containing protein [Candidatus Saccharimonadales bacterium]|jgi:hypothetical protein|nr:DUF3072 domain-containing protein [Candidatus Saccharimonadales bacterium]